MLAETFQPSGTTNRDLGPSELPGLRRVPFPLSSLVSSCFWLLALTLNASNSVPAYRSSGELRVTATFREATVLTMFQQLSLNNSSSKRSAAASCLPEPLSCEAG